MSTCKQTQGRPIPARRFLPALAAALAWAAVPAAQAECLQVDNHNLAEADTRYGVTTAEWTADVENSCEAPYDATLTVQFVDAEAQVLHRAVEIVMLQPGEILQAGKRVNLAEEKYARIDEIRVAVQERERPR